MQPLTPAPDTVTHDAPCTRCGYNLRGLSRPLGNCPECGQSVRASFRQRPLEHASPEWLRRLTWGFRCTRVALVAAIFAGMFVAMPKPRGTPKEPMLVAWLTTIALALCGMLVAAEPQPLVEVFAARRFTLRVLRVSAAAFVLASATATALFAFAPPSMSATVLTVIFAIVALIALQLALRAFVTCTDELLLRNDQPAAPRVTGLLFYMFIVFELLVALAGLAFIVSIVFPRARAIVEYPAMAAPVILAGIGLVLLAHCSDALRLLGRALKQDR